MQATHLFSSAALAAIALLPANVPGTWLGPSPLQEASVPARVRYVWTASHGADAEDEVKSIGRRIDQYFGANYETVSVFFQSKDSKETTELLVTHDVPDGAALEAFWGRAKKDEGFQALLKEWEQATTAGPETIYVAASPQPGDGTWLAHYRLLHSARPRLGRSRDVLEILRRAAQHVNDRYDDVELSVYTTYEDGIAVALFEDHRDTGSLVRNQAALRDDTTYQALLAELSGLLVDDRLATRTLYRPWEIAQ